MQEPIIIFFLSFVWFMLSALQSRLLNHEATKSSLFSAAMATSIVWVTLIRKIVIDNNTINILAYALGSSIGIISAKEFHVRYENNKLKGNGGDTN